MHLKTSCRVLGILDGMSSNHHALHLKLVGWLVGSRFKMYNFLCTNECDSFYNLHHTVPLLGIKLGLVLKIHTGYSKICLSPSHTLNTQWWYKNCHEMIFKISYHTCYTTSHSRFSWIVCKSGNIQNISLRKSCIACADPCICFVGLQRYIFLMCISAGE